MLYELDGHSPKVGENCFVAPNASVIGKVELKDNASVWFGATIRADDDWVTIGKNSNIQDGCVVHVDKGAPVVVGDNVTVGHKVMLHGCTIGEGSLIGMNSVVLDRSVIGKNCLIGANTLVTEGMVVPDGSLVLGSPGKVVKTLSDEAQKKFAGGASHYTAKSELFRNTLKPIE